MNYIVITIPKDQWIQKSDDLFTILVNGFPVQLVAEHQTSSASYDIQFTPDEFNPMLHGFRGMNLSLVQFLQALGFENKHMTEYMAQRAIIAKM